MRLAKYIEKVYIIVKEINKGDAADATGSDKIHLLS